MKVLLAILGIATISFSFRANAVGESTASSTPESTASAADPFSWLEDLRGERSLEWVRAENEKTFRSLKADPRFTSYYEAALAIFSRPKDGGSDQYLRNGWIYRTLRNESHLRGLWQRARLDSYLSASPHWRPVLDADLLSGDGGWPVTVLDTNTTCLGRRCMITLVPDGADYSAAHAQRELDIESRTFVKNGFVLPEPATKTYSQTELVWKDPDTLYVVDHPTLGNDGPFVVREWSRGTPLSAAKEAFRGAAPILGKSQGNGAITVLREGKSRREVVLLDPITGTSFRVGKSGRPEKLIQAPSFEPIGLHRDQWIFRVTEDVTLGDRRWKQLSIVSISDSEITGPHPAIHLMIEPSAQDVLPLVEPTPGGVLVTTLQNVRGRLSMFRFEGGTWNRKMLPLPDYGNIGLYQVSPETDVALVSYENSIYPTSLYSVDTRTLQVKQVKRGYDQFDAQHLMIEQLWAKSKDGTQVPYFVVRPKSLQMNGQAPTLLSGYGNAGAVDVPYYDGVLGKLWLEKGGVYVWASIRGGGELGPDWAVMKTERRRTYEDFVAVAEDLIRRRITSPRHLGMQGHSMGGCLVGVTFNERPDLFNAAISMNGVLDQVSDNARGAGTTDVWGSWDVPEERAFLESTSPYHNLRKRKDAPPPLVTTSTDDGIPAFEARKYAAKLASFDSPYFFYESPEGGHGFGVTPQQFALHQALVYTYLAKQLMPSDAR